MLQFFIFLSIAVNFSISKLEHLEINELHTRNSLKKCVIEACRTFFTGDFETITYSLPLTEVSKDLNSVVTMPQILLPILENEYNWTMLINSKHAMSTNNFENLMSKSSAYVIQIRTAGEIFHVVDKLYLWSWNPQAKFLIISSTRFEQPLKIAMEVTKVLWLAKVVNVAVLLVNPKNITEFNVYSWKPYSPESCGDNFSNTYSISSCSFGIIDQREPWFNNHIGTELFNCTLKAAYTIWPPYVLNITTEVQSNSYLLSQGIEINLLNMIADSLNTFIIYEETNFTLWEQFTKGEIFIQDLTFLEENKIDLLVGAYPKTLEVCEFLDCARTYIQEKYVWCMPHILLLTNSNAMIKIFDKKVWTCLICSYILFTIFIWYLKSKYQRQALNWQNLLKALLNNFSVGIGFAVSKLPVSMRLRYLVGLLIICSLYINITYTSTFTSLLSKPSKLEKFNSIESIYYYNLDTYFISESIRYFKSTDLNEDNYISNVPIETIQRKWLNCTNTRRCLRDVGLKQKSAICLPKLHKRYLFTHDESIQRIQHHIYCIDDSIVSFPVTTLMRKGFPLLKLFNRVIDRIVSAGFIAKWVNEMVESKYTIRKDRFIDKFETIKFKNLFPVFRVLILGQYLSFIMFVVEVIYYKIISRRQKKVIIGKK